MTFGREGTWVELVEETAGMREVEEEPSVAIVKNWLLNRKGKL